MVYLIALEGQPPVVERAERLLQQTLKGWVLVKPRVWLGGTDLEAAFLRDWLTGEVPGLQVFIARLTGTWASRGLASVANWMKGAGGAF